MNPLNADRSVCRKEFVIAAFPSQKNWDNFHILEAGGRDDLFSLLKQEFRGTEIVRNTLQEEENEEEKKFDYIVALGKKYIPCDTESENPYPRLLARLKPGGILAGAVCGFSGYYGLLMLGSVIETLSKNKALKESLEITEAVITQLPPNHPVLETGREDFVRRLKTGDETAFNDLMDLTRSIRHIDRLFTVSKLFDAFPRWGGRFYRWVFPENYAPSTLVDPFRDLPEPRRAVVAECISASPPDHYFLLENIHAKIY